MKIFNWIGGSFFRTLGRFIFYFVAGSFLAFLLKDFDFSNLLMEDVHALEYNYDYISNYDVPFRSYIHKSSDLELMTGMVGDLIYNSGATTITNAVITRSYQANKNTTSISSGSEIWITTNVGLRNAGNLYSYQLLLCTNKAIMSYVDYEFGFNAWNSYYIPQYTYKTQNWSAADSSSSGFIADSSNISNCYLFSGYGVYKSNTTGLSVHFTGTSSLSGVRFYIMGYKVDDLGYYKENLLSDIEDMIDNNMSGVATKSDIQSVQSSIDQTNQAIDDVNDTLNDDSIDDSKISGSLGDMQNSYTNPTTTGPLSGFLLMPLTWVQSFLAPSGSCQPIDLPLPYVNRTLTLPCMTSFWNSMGLVATLIEMVWIAVVGTRIFNGLFLIVTEIKNPEPDKDMTLVKSWEL